MREAITRLICCAAGELDWSSVVPQTGHMTSPSSSFSVGWRSLAWATGTSEQSRDQDEDEPSHDAAICRRYRGRSSSTTSSPTTLPLRATKKIRGIGSPPHFVRTLPLPSCTLGYVMPCLRCQLRASPEKSFVSTPMNATRLPYCLPRRLEPLRLVDARDAPRRPEVEDDRLLPRSDARSMRPRPSSRAQVERGRGRMLVRLSSALRDALVAVVAQRARSSSASKPTTSATGQPLRCEPGRPSHQAATMKTVVPIVDVVEEPLGLRDVHTDAAVRRPSSRSRRPRECRGCRRRAPTAPSSACRADCPGRAESASALRPGRVRWIPPWVPPLDDDREAAERRRVLMTDRSRRRRSGDTAIPS